MIAQLALVFSCFIPAEATQRSAQDSVPRCVKRHDLVLVFSAGHTGSTSLAQRDLYSDGCRKAEVLNLVFEQGHARGLVPRVTGHPCNLRAWYGRDDGRDVSASVDREAEVVSRYYLRSWRREGAAETTVVAGHDSLLYYRGVLKVSISI